MTTTFRQAMELCRAAMLTELQMALGAARPHQIADGAAKEFAEAVCYRCPAARLATCPLPLRDADYTYLIYQGRCYDAECLEGVSTPQQLPIFRRIRSDGALFADTQLSDCYAPV